LQIQDGRSVVVIVNHALIVKVGGNPILPDGCSSISFCNAENVQVVVNKLCKSSCSTLVGQRNGVPDGNVELNVLCAKLIVVVGGRVGTIETVGDEVGGERLIPKNLELGGVDGIDRRINVHLMKELSGVASNELHSVGLKILNNNHSIADATTVFVAGVTAKSKSPLDLNLFDCDLETDALRRCSTLSNAMKLAV